jgi:uncharacterized membrane protein (DUF4010 family)
MVAALAELHAAIATLAQLFRQNELDADQVRWGLLGILAMSVVTKAVVASLSGGRAFGVRVATGLFVMLLAVLGVQLVEAWMR